MEYQKRDHEVQGDYYLRHLSAMTSEGLHSKSEIAGELAARDIEIDSLRAEIERMEPMKIALCGRHSLVLRVGVSYVFRPVGDCTSCAKMVAAAREAYGPELGA